jgi:hypothetical protein
MEGGIVTWIHRDLGAVKSEVQLQRILLRLFQSGLAKYAQIRHGPIEYGKDIAVLVYENGNHILKLYQVKCGDINKKIWRDCQSELEEATLVPLASIQLPISPDSVEVILITNGHANPHVEPVMAGWMGRQREQGRNVTFMHLDSVVDWITQHKLTSELRLALAENGAKQPEKKKKRRSRKPTARLRRVRKVRPKQKK